jgi:hypothetical protein
VVVAPEKDKRGDNEAEQMYGRRRKGRILQLYIHNLRVFGLETGK